MKKIDGDGEIYSKGDGDYLWAYRGDGPGNGSTGGFFELSKRWRAYVVVAMGRH